MCAHKDDEMEQEALNQVRVQEMEQEALNQVRTQSLRILLVEDDAFSASVITEWCLDCNFSVDACPTCA